MPSRTKLQQTVDRARPVLRSILGREPARSTPDRETISSCFDEQERELVARCRPHTMVSDERLIATVDAVEHVVRREVPGDLVECGVWRGGNVLAMILTLQRLGVDDRHVHLCDTFTGMTEPTVEDTSEIHGSAIDGERAWEALFEADVFGREQVEALLASTGYPSAQIHFVVGPVEETLPTSAPDRIAVLRLDTDWYQSTRHELDHLYPRLSPGGVLLVDDYGHWDGARRAVDEYFDENGARPHFARTDYSGRMAIKW